MGGRGGNGRIMKVVKNPGTMYYYDDDVGVERCRDGAREPLRQSEGQREDELRLRANLQTGSEGLIGPYK
jgi:hypothetical protein